MEIHDFEWKGFSIVGVFLAFLADQNCEIRDDLKNDKNEHPTKKPKTEILKQEVKLVVREN